MTTKRERRIAQHCQKIIEEGLGQLANPQEQREYWHDDSSFYSMAICALHLEQFAAAKNWLNQAVVGMQAAKRPAWLRGKTVNEPIEAAILADRIDTLDSFVERCQVYADKPFPVYTYALGLAHLAANRQDLCEQAIRELFTRTKVKECALWAGALQAIMLAKSDALEQALESLLIVHDNTAKHGELRWSPHGYVAMSALALLALGRRQGLRVEISNFYLPNRYVDYLLGG